MSQFYAVLIHQSIIKIGCATILKLHDVHTRIVINLVISWNHAQVTCYTLNILKIYSFYMTTQSQVILQGIHSFWLGMIFGEHRFKKKTHSTRQLTQQWHLKWCSVCSWSPLITWKISWEGPQRDLLTHIMNMKMINY